MRKECHICYYYYSYYSCARSTTFIIVIILIIDPLNQIPPTPFGQNRRDPVIEKPDQTTSRQMNYFNIRNRPVHLSPLERLVV